MASLALIGRDIGNYNVVRLIGEGGMGAVFEARHRFLGDRVAVKVLHGNYAHNPQIAQRFFQEAKAARDIGHPSIIKVFDFGQSDDGSLYLVMELLDGQSLTDVIARGALLEETAARIAADLAEGLAAAHARGVVHRDLKPDNIFIASECVKILDFGIAKVVSAGGHTGTNALLGTPKYMAPEQARGAKFVGPHSDIWSLGVILYQMLTGHLPFDGTDIIEIIFKISTETPPRPSELARVSAQMEQIVLRCLDKSPSSRPSSMGELRALLTPWAGPPAQMPVRVLTSAPTLALSPRPPEHATTLSGGTGERLEPARTTGNRARAIALAAAGGLLMIGGGAAITMLLQQRASPPVTVAAAPPIPSPSPAPTPVNVSPQPAVAAPAAHDAAEQEIAFDSDPSEADIILDDKLVGKTPATLKTRLPADYVLHKKGYLDVKIEVTKPGKQPVIFLKKRSGGSGRSQGNETKPGGSQQGTKPPEPGWDEK